MYAFLDESGDHNLDMTKVDNNYNIFVLGLVLIKKENYPLIDKEFKSIKKEVFGDENFVVHNWELTHPVNKKSDRRNLVMRDLKIRHDFYKRMCAFIESIKISCCYVVIDKKNFKEKYRTPVDPYELSFENLLNRILYYSKSEEIEIICECRSKQLDASIQAEFAKYSIKGTRFHSSTSIKSRIKSIEIKNKKDNHTGLQLADLVTSPVGRHFLGIKPKAEKNNEIPYSLIRKKLAGTEKVSITLIP